MALISCPEPECGRKISDQAAFCPHCGRTMQSAIPAWTHSQVPSSVSPTADTLPSQIIDGRLDLSDVWLLMKDLDSLVSEALPFVRSGQVFELTIVGDRWTDQDIKLICDLLVPGLPSGWDRLRHQLHAPAHLQPLCRLTLRICGQLTHSAMRDLSRLSSLSEVNLAMWDPCDSALDAILELLQLPDLKKLVLPMQIKNRDMVVQVIQKNMPHINVT